MGDRSGIEWTDASWNPVTGCTEVSAGCDNCYAARLARGKLATVYGKREPTVDTPENRADPFAVRLWPERLDQPARWIRPRRIFVNSMSDMFHKDVSERFLLRCFDAMTDAPHHVYQILTKRPALAHVFLTKHGMTLPDYIWIGTSVEDQSVAYRLRHLKDCPAAVRFVSVEPLIGPVVLGEALTWLDWVIVGGESGPGHRPIDTNWVRDLRDECTAAGVAFFFKQWGGHTPKAGGRELDGRTWSEYPQTAAP